MSTCEANSEVHVELLCPLSDHPQRARGGQPRGRGGARAPATACPTGAAVSSAGAGYAARTYLQRGLTSLRNTGEQHPPPGKGHQE